MARATVIFRSAGTVVARMAGNSNEMTVMCQPILVAAEALAAAHVRTGRYAASFGVDTIPGKKGVKDRAVFNSDPQAHIIEGGHLEIGKDDEGSPTVKFVEGLHILRRAARSAVL